MQPTITKEQLESWYQNKSSREIMMDEEEYIFDNGSKYEILPEEYEPERGEEFED